ncbi:MAG: VOC family protein [Micromonosporaceae bacterium]
MFTEAFPILTTPDLTRALAFYRDVLGATVSYQFPPEAEPSYVGLKLGSSDLGIGLEPETVTGADGQRISLWLYAEDCDTAVARARTGGATLVEEPTDQPWGERVARLLDPDGNLLVIGSRR